MQCPEFLSASDMFNLLYQKISCTGGLPDGKCTNYNELGDRPLVTDELVEIEK